MKNLKLFGTLLLMGLVVIQIGCDKFHMPTASTESNNREIELDALGDDGSGLLIENSEIIQYTSDDELQITGYFQLRIFKYSLPFGQDTELYGKVYQTSNTRFLFEFGPSAYLSKDAELELKWDKLINKDFISNVTLNQLNLNTGEYEKLAEYQNGTSGFGWGGAAEKVKFFTSQLTTFEVLIETIPFDSEFEVHRLIEYDSDKELKIDDYFKFKIFKYSLSQDMELYGKLEIVSDIKFLYHFGPVGTQLAKNAEVELKWDKLIRKEFIGNVTLSQSNPITGEFEKISEFNGLIDENFEWHDDGNKVKFYASQLTTFEIAIEKIVFLENMWLSKKDIKWNDGGDLKIDKLFKLKVHKNSMSFNGEVRFFAQAQILEDGSLQFYFEPHGLDFMPEAELELHWDKLQKQGVDKPLKLKYYNPNSKKWELESSFNEVTGDVEDVNVEDIWDKDLKKVKFKVPHFSLWAISKD